ncbi:hypothetical protein CH333_05015 [candidate division WOR-3 bacterium JGI_Cruoil_03_44_89]|uniref:Secretion system C-terminal sorting domain-containing protein n=1 Tax=candidate division WOR-3 bacterium JGI_Cruoil_03_44_89 TaxID=1973748 RepID=A0A235BVI8_UNCW3|nr:MAG: hypothetical protein CH333_05015 [candidate division WOR-3 bacterium JGI_Cruoil_03_44_89]
MKCASISVTLVLLILVSHSHALMTFERWYGGDNDDRGNCVQQTSDGGYIVVGNTLSFGAGGFDIYLIKTDSLGDTNWTKTYGGGENELCFSVRQTYDDGYITAGWTASYGAGGQDVYLIKTDNTGSVQWVKTYGGAEADAAHSIDCTSDGGYITAGYTFSYSIGNSDVWIIKVDSNGDTIWTKTYGGTESDVANSVAQTFDGGYIIAGVTSSYTASPGTTQAIYLIKIDSLGDTMWMRVYGEQQTWICEGAHNVHQTKDKGYIIAGYEMTCSGFFWHPYVVKTDSIGDTIWTKAYEELTSQRSGYYSIQQTVDGGYIMGGAIGWLPGINVFLSKLNSRGDIIWIKEYGGEEPDDAYFVQETYDKGYIIVGCTQSFGINGDVYFIKTDSVGNVYGVEEDNTSQISNSKSHLQVYPNPFTHYCRIARDGHSSLQLYDLTGKLIGVVKDNTIDKELKSGIYFLKAKGYKPVKIVKLR